MPALNREFPKLTEPSDRRYLLGQKPKPIRVCVIGAGAMGGLLAVRLALAGNEVTIIARGAHLAAIRDHGLTLKWRDGKVETAQVTAHSEPAKAGVHDLVILAVKAHALDQAVSGIEQLLGEDTIILTVQNGLPWWYFQKHGGPFDNRRLESLDPSGILAAKIDPDRLLGCVIYSAAAVTAPGMIGNAEGDHFPIGELDGRQTARAKHIHDVLVGAGLRSAVLTDIRTEIWIKAWGNLSFNPISALTRALLDELCRNPETRWLAAKMMEEAQAVAEKFGIRFPVTIEERIAIAEKVGAHKTSMLQDVEAGRPLETEALLGAVLEMARWTDTPAPALEVVYACIKLLDGTMRPTGPGPGQ